MHLLTIEGNLLGYLLNEISQEVSRRSQFMLMFSAGKVNVVPRNVFSQVCTFTFDLANMYMIIVDAIVFLFKFP